MVVEIRFTGGSRLLAAATKPLSDLDPQCKHRHHLATIRQLAELVYCTLLRRQLAHPLREVDATMSRPNPVSRRSAKTEYIETVGRLFYQQFKLQATL